MIRSGWIIFVAAANLAASGCSKTGTRVQAEVWQTGGADDVSSQRLLTSEKKPFIAPPGGRTIIALTPGIYVSAAAGSELTITDSRIKEDGNETGPGAMTLRRAELRLTTGELCAYLPSDDRGGNSQITIETRGAAVSAGHGSLFLLRSTADEVRVTAARGEVHLTAAGAERTVAAGDYVTFQPDATASGLVVAPAASDSAAQTDVDAVLDAESSIRDLVQVHTALPAEWVRR